MVITGKTPHPSLLRYTLAPDDSARQALDDTIAAYLRMIEILTGLVSDRTGANLVVLHDLAYETVREQTGLLKQGWSRSAFAISPPIAASPPIRRICRSMTSSSPSKAPRT